jgi:hypothetical protein
MSSTAEAKSMGRKTGLPTTEGKWLDEHIFRTAAGVDCVDRHYLTDNHPGIGLENWRRWLKSLNPDLGRKLRGFDVQSHPNMRAKGYETTIVWVQSDVELAARQRTDTRARKTPPDLPGRWLTETVWEDQEFGKCLRDEQLAGLLKRTTNYLVGRRHRPHPALDRNGNGGKPRFRKVPKLTTGDTLLKRSGKRRLGEGLVIVSCLSDFERIAEWDEAQAGRVVPEVWKLFNQVAEATGIIGNTNRFELGLALQLFRVECPGSAGQAWGPERRPNQRQPPWRYDPEAFDRWLNGRTIKEVAAPLRRRDNSKTNRKLRRAVLFLQFVLTQGDFSVRRFNSFVADPPAGDLAPCAPVLGKTVVEWARLAHIGTDKTLPKARKELGVKHLLKGSGAAMKSYWSLPGLVRVEAGPLVTRTETAAPPTRLPADSEGVETLRATEPQHDKHAGGRPTGRDDARKYCYERFVKGDKLSAILGGAKTLHGSNAPKDTSQVTSTPTLPPDPPTLPQVGGPPLTEWFVAVDYDRDLGLRPMVPQGPPGTPTEIVRVRAPSCVKRVWWAAQCAADKPQLPSPDTQSSNEVLIRDRRGGTAPGITIDGQPVWQCSGYYEYALQSPPGPNDPLTLGVGQYDPGSITVCVLSPSDFFSRFLRPSVAPAGTGGAPQVNF